MTGRLESRTCLCKWPLRWCRCGLMNVTLVLRAPGKNLENSGIDESALSLYLDNASGSGNKEEKPVDLRQPTRQG